MLSRLIRSTHRHWQICLPAIACLAGCTSSPSTEVSPSTEEPASSNVNVTIESWERIERYIKSKQGQVVVVDLWSTSCQPCMREFPGLVDLHKKYPDIVCVSVNTDYYGDPSEPPESFRPRVEEFLTMHDATFENFICSDESDAVMAQVDAFSVPVVQVYGANGELRKQFMDDVMQYGEEGFSYADHVEPLVAELASGEG